MASASHSGSAFKKSLIPWSKLDVELSEKTMRVLFNSGFNKMTAVQSSVIPLLLGNKDVAVEAVTGSGKTLSFVIPVVEMLQRIGDLHGNRVYAVVISPTRELACQISEVFGLFTEDSPLSLGCFTGGHDMEKDITDFNTSGANIIVATPGHLQEMLHQKRCHLAQSLRSLDVLVLDEADRLLDMGFRESLNDILSYLPKQRRTGLFSATQTRQLEDLVRAGLRNPLFVKIQEKKSATSQQRTPSQLQNYYTIVQPDMKVTHLVEFLRSHKKEKVMVFIATCAGVDYMYSLLANLVRGTELLAIHGKMKGKRQNVFQKFSSMDSGILLCTDVMARGVDFPSVDWVVQFDPPSTSNVFVHRCGRTARIGHSGQALLILLENEEPFVDFLKIHQQVVLEQWSCDWTLASLTDRIRKMAVRDRDVYEKGNNAFVSFIQSYGKNECNLIFQLKELHVGELAEGMGLLRLPKMPELRGKNLQGFTPSDIDLREIKYRDKHREKQRQVSLTAKKRKAEQASLKVKAKTHKNSDMSLKIKGKSRKRCPGGMSQRDMEELAEGARLLKRFKRGKISKEEFDDKLEHL